jgi:hypothetical protein
MNANHTFLKETLPGFCKSESIASLIHNLNMYGFKKIVSGPFSGSYFHPQFKRGQQRRLRPQQSKAKPRFTKGMPTIFEIESGTLLEVSTRMPCSKDNEIATTSNIIIQCARPAIEKLPGFNVKKITSGKIESTSDKKGCKTKRVRFQLDVMPHQEKKQLKMEKVEASSSISVTAENGRDKSKEILSQFRKPSTKSFAQIVVNRHNPWSGGKMPSFSSFQEDALSRCDMISVKRKVENRKRKLGYGCERSIFPTLGSFKRRRHQLHLQHSLERPREEGNLTPTQIQTLEIFARLGSNSLLDTDLLCQEFRNSRRVAIITR